MCNNDCLQGCDLAMDMYVLCDALETQILFTIQENHSLHGKYVCQINNFSFAVGKVILVSQIEQLHFFHNLYSSIFCRSFVHKSYMLDSPGGSVQLSSDSQSCPTLCGPMDCRMPGLPVHHQLQELFKLTSIESVMPFNHLIRC